jgi:hypothetical protein
MKEKTKEFVCPHCDGALPESLTQEIALAVFGEFRREKKSVKKAVTSRENGKKGGRPKKDKTKSAFTNIKE